MARGDPTFAKIDVDIFHDEKVGSLTAAEAFCYIGLWCMAVKYRTDVLERDKFPVKKLAAYLEKDRKTVGRWVDKLRRVSLIEMNARGDITICRVKGVHNKLHWDKCPRTGPIRAPYGSQLREIESRRDRETPHIPSPPDPESAFKRRIPGTRDSSVNTGPHPGASLLNKEARPESPQKPKASELERRDIPVLQETVWILERELDVDEQNERDHLAVVDNLRKFGMKISNLAVMRVKDAVHAYNEGQRQTPVANKLAYWISSCRQIAQQASSEETSLPLEDGIPQ
jgi:hypothetical protein